MNNLRQTIQIVVLAVVAAATAACASSTHSTRQPLRPMSACPSLNQSPEMYTPDNRTVVMKTGPSFYRVDLMNDCGRLNATTLRFKLASGTGSARRLCGDVGDELINSDGMHCTIKRVTPIDKQQFMALQEQSKARR